MLGRYARLGPLGAPRAEIARRSRPRSTAATPWPCRRGRPTRCRAANGSGCGWPARWRRSRPCCCWTSPPRRSTCATRWRSSSSSARLVDDGLAGLVITHQLNLAARFADRILLLNEGRVVAEGTPREVLREDTLEPGLRVAGRGHAVARRLAAGVPLRRGAAAMRARRSCSPWRRGGRAGRRAGAGPDHGPRARRRLPGAGAERRDPGRRAARVDRARRSASCSAACRPAALELRVRRIGYAPLGARSSSVVPGPRADRVVALEPLPVQLDSVTVAAAPGAIAIDGADLVRRGGDLARALDGWEGIVVRRAGNGPAAPAGPRRRTRRGAGAGRRLSDQRPAHRPGRPEPDLEPGGRRGHAAARSPDGARRQSGRRGRARGGDPPRCAARGVRVGRQPRGAGAGGSAARRAGSRRAPPVSAWPTTSPTRCRPCAAVEKRPASTPAASSTPPRSATTGRSSWCFADRSPTAACRGPPPIPTPRPTRGSVGAARRATVGRLAVSGSLQWLEARASDPAPPTGPRLRQLHPWDGRDAGGRLPRPARRGRLDRAPSTMSGEGRANRFGGDGVRSGASFTQARCACRRPFHPRGWWNDVEPRARRAARRVDRLDHPAWRARGSTAGGNAGAPRSRSASAAVSPRRCWPTCSFGKASVCASIPTSAPSACAGRSRGACGASWPPEARSASGCSRGRWQT